MNFLSKRQKRGNQTSILESCTKCFGKILGIYNVRRFFIFGLGFLKLFTFRYSGRFEAKL